MADVFVLALKLVIAKLANKTPRWQQLLAFDRCGTALHAFSLALTVDLSLDNGEQH